MVRPGPRLLERPMPEFPGRMRADAQSPRYPGAGLRKTERAGAHSPRFGTYALWTAGLLAALAVRPVPSCSASLPRDVNDQPPSDVCPVQLASR